MPSIPTKNIETLQKEINDGIDTLKNDIDNLKPEKLGGFEKNASRLRGILSSLGNNKSMQREAKINRYSKELIGELNNLISATKKMANNSKNKTPELLEFYRDFLNQVHICLENKNDNENDLAELKELANKYEAYPSPSCTLFQHRQAPVAELKRIATILGNIAKLENQKDTSNTTNPFDFVSKDLTKELENDFAELTNGNILRF